MSVYVRQVAEGIKPSPAQLPCCEGGATVMASLLTIAAKATEPFNKAILPFLVPFVKNLSKEAMNAPRGPGRCPLETLLDGEFLLEPSGLLEQS